MRRAARIVLLILSAVAAALGIVGLLVALLLAGVGNPPPAWGWPLIVVGCVLPASLLALGARLLGRPEREGQAAGFGIVVVIVGGVAGAVGAIVGLVIAAETGGDPELCRNAPQRRCAAGLGDARAGTRQLCERAPRRRRLRMRAAQEDRKPTRTNTHIQRPWASGLPMADL